MNGKIKITLALTSLFAVRTLLGQAARTPEAQLKAAHDKVEFEGDLKGAVELYTKVANGKDRAAAAKALLEIGHLYERLGRPEAQKIYEKITNDYKDQRNQVAEARKRLEDFAGRLLTVRDIWVSRSDEADLSESSVSTDGRWLVFANRITFDLEIRDNLTGELQQLQAGSQQEGRTARAPVLSPDSSQVAYRWYTGSLAAEANNFRMSELRIASTKPGSKPRVLIPASPQNEYVQPAAWSRDGRLLARIWKNDGTVQIAWISVRDGSVSVLRSLWQRSPGRPTLSPDGKYIAYSALATESVRSINPAPEGNSHIYVLATNGGPETEVVGGNSSNEGPVWSADGNHILFSSNRKNGEFGLWSVPVREGKPGDPPELLKPGTGRLIPIGLTSSGSLYFANRQREGDEAFVIQFSEPDGKIYGPSSPLTENFVGTNRGVSWSPDGEFIAFKRERATKKGTFDVVVRNVASREERTYSTSLFEIGPEATNWFQDSKGLVQYDSAGTYYRLDLMSGEFRKIATGSSQLSYGTAAIPSPDNNVLYVTASDSAIKGLGFNRIVAFDLKAGLERSVFTSSEVFGTFALSPDGRTLAIMSANTGGGSKWINGRFLMQMGSPQPVRLSVVGIDGTGYRLLYGPFPILENPSSNALVWTRDGRSVLFGMSHPDRPLVTQVMRLSIQGGEPRYTGLDIRGPFHYVSLAPGNASIAFSETLQDRWRLSAVDNVFPSRKLP